MKTGVFTSNRWKIAFTLFSIACYLKYNHYHSPVEAKCNLNMGLVEINFINENFSLAVCVQERSPYGGQEQCAREEYTCDCLETNGLQSFKVYYDKLTTVLPIVKK